MRKRLRLHILLPSLLLLGLIANFATQVNANSEWDLPSDPHLPSLLENDFLAWIIGMFTTHIGDTFFLCVAMLLWVPLYIRSQSVTLPSIVWMLLGGLIITAMPVVSPIAVLILSFGLAGLIFKVFTKIR